MLLARTDPASRGRSGLTWFVINMDQPGVEVRPLREMTGRSLFTEVFLDGALVPAADVVGEVGGGWPVARTTLANERAGLAEGGAVGGTPGRKAGMLDVPCDDVASRLTAPRRRSGTAAAMRARAFDQLLAASRLRGKTRDPVLRQDLARLYTLELLASLDSRRKPPGVAKLTQGRIVRLASQVGQQVLGAEGTLASGDTPDIALLSEFSLFAPAVSIYGGTDEIQRNQLAERVLGLPRE
jgi:alkylation response protein AidB-like acyl-CoA dehydrogenase